MISPANYLNYVKQIRELEDYKAAIEDISAACMTHPNNIHSTWGASLIIAAEETLAAGLSDKEIINMIAAEMNKG